MTGSALLRLNGVRRSYGHQEVLRGIDFDLFAGDVALVVGRNGAGKSSLLKLCAGLLRPQSGTRTVASEGPISYLGHALQLYSDLTIEEQLTYSLALRRAEPARVDETISGWKLNHERHLQIRTLSRGMQTRVALASAIDSRSPLAILDEPTSNLDDKNVELLFERLAPIRARGAILIATHDMGRLESRATRVILLEGGRISSDSSTSGAIGAVVEEYRRVNA